MDWTHVTLLGSTSVEETGSFNLGLELCSHCGAPLSPRGLCNDDCDGSRAAALEEASS